MLSQNIIFIHFLLSYANNISAVCFVSKCRIMPIDITESIVSPAKWEKRTLREKLREYAVAYNRYATISSYIIIRSPRWWLLTVFFVISTTCWPLSSCVLWQAVIFTERKRERTNERGQFRLLNLNIKISIENEVWCILPPFHQEATSLINTHIRPWTVGESDLKIEVTNTAVWPVRCVCASLYFMNNISRRFAMAATMQCAYVWTAAVL